jgi:hypothetical protein
VVLKDWVYEENVFVKSVPFFMALANVFLWSDLEKEIDKFNP